MPTKAYRSNHEMSNTHAETRSADMSQPARSKVGQACPHSGKRLLCCSSDWNSFWTDQLGWAALLIFWTDPLDTLKLLPLLIDLAARSAESVVTRHISLSNLVTSRLNRSSARRVNERGNALV